MGLRPEPGNLPSELGPGAISHNTTLALHSVTPSRGVMSSSEKYEVVANGRCIQRKIYRFKTISKRGSTLMQTQLFCVWLDQEMWVAHNPYLDHVQSAPFAFYSTEGLGV